MSQVSISTGLPSTAVEAITLRSVYKREVILLTKPVTWQTSKKTFHTSTDCNDQIKHWKHFEKQILLIYFFVKFFHITYLLIFRFWLATWNNVQILSSAVKWFYCKLHQNSRSRILMQYCCALWQRKKERDARTVREVRRASRVQMLTVVCGVVVNNHLS